MFCVDEFMQQFMSVIPRFVPKRNPIAKCSAPSRSFVKPQRLRDGKKLRIRGQLDKSDLLQTNPFWVAHARPSSISSLWLAKRSLCLFLRKIPTPERLRRRLFPLYHLVNVVQRSPLSGMGVREVLIGIDAPAFPDGFQIGGDAPAVGFGRSRVTSVRAL